MTQEFLGNLILPDRILYGGKIYCEKGVIVKIEENAVPGGADLPYILPGLVDIHNHGALGCDYMDCTEDSFRTIAAYLASHGVTSAQCATVSAPVEQILDFLRFYREQCDCCVDGSGCRFVGVHIEGPYISLKKKGAHPAHTLLTAEDGYDWILANRDVIREVTVAPELAGMPRMIRDLTDAGILVSGGHDDAEPEDILLAAQRGMRHCTHIYCAMSTLHYTGMKRNTGLCEYVMSHPDISAEMIADNHHIPPMLAQIIYKAKGAEKLCLVSDAIAPAGLPQDGTVYNLGTGENCTRVVMEDGVAMVADRSCYAGSVQPLDQMIRNLVCDANIPLVDAVRMASLTPAKIIGLDSQFGSIAPGKRADLCFMDSGLQVVQTVIAGKMAYQK